MMKEHLTDEQLQAYTTDPAASTGWVQQHIATCTNCRNSVRMYTRLFSALREQPVPVLDFDVAALVLPALPSLGTKRMPAPYWLIALLTIAATVPLYLVKENIVNLFSGMPQFFLCACGGSAVILLLVRLLQLIKNYKERFNLLNDFPDLQP